MTTTLSMMGKITDKDYDIQITGIVNLLNSPVWQKQGNFCENVHENPVDWTVHPVDPEALHLCTQLRSGFSF